MADFDLEKFSAPDNFDEVFLTIRPLGRGGPNFWTAQINCGSLNAPTIRELIALIRGVLSEQAPA